jgi:peptide/nickel transport system permease protein
MSQEFGWGYYLREVFRSRSGAVGIVMLSILLAAAVYVTLTTPPSVFQSWFNPANWVNNPINVPPTWINYFNGGKNPPSLQVPITFKKIYSSPTIYVYTGVANFTYSYSSYPTDVSLYLSFSGKISSINVQWVKPDGSSVNFSVSQPTAPSSYDAASVQLQQGVLQYLSKVTGRSYTSLSQAQVVQVLLSPPSTLSSNPRVEKGVYGLKLLVIASSQVNFSRADLFLKGSSFGTMGTDFEGRPIGLGLLLGLPNALEIGALTSIASVIPGVLYGGISGYLGGRKDGVMQWLMLVFLALPALPFLVVMSYVLKTSLSIELEALLIAFLSWPFYAIIARSAALSIKSQAFIEADRVMGIPSYRSFFTHFMPRLIPLTIAYTALGVPGGIILGETLAFLGIQPANVVTWGRILEDAYANFAAVNGFWWWVLFPGIMIVVVSFPFVLVGFAIERIVAPRVSVK